MTQRRWFPLALFGGVAALLYIVVAVAANAAEPFYHGPSLLGGWVRFDAGWYRNIADNGYFFKGTAEQSSVAFFPLYPLLTRWLHDAVGGDPSAWGVAITFAAGCASAALYWRWLASMAISDAQQRLAFAAFVFWPYAFYLYGAVYADALFVALVLAAFVHVERDRVAWAAVFGALATATRPVGAAVVLGLVARVLERRGVITFNLRVAGDRVRVVLHRLRRTDPLILLAGAGLLVYMAYLWRTFDDPFAFATAEAAPGWDQKPGPKVWFKTAWFSRLVHLPGSGPRYFAAVTLQGLLVLALVLLIPRVVRRFGWAYGLYTAALLAVPLIGSKDFQGLGRYAPGAFPAFAVLGQLLGEHPRLRVAWFAFAVAALIFFTAAFSRGGYVA